MHSNFITPPDFVTEDKHTVVIVNAAWEDVELVAKCCKTSDHEFNVYLYSEEMDNIAWLTKITSLANAIIVNDKNLENGLIRGTLSNCTNCYYYNRNTDSDRNILSPVEYFLQYTNKEVNNIL
jgi:hypothetical protein